MFHRRIALRRDQYNDNWHAFIFLLERINNPGMDRLEAYLSTHNFTTAPSSDSTRHHHCWRGGWVQHALGVYIRMVRKNGNRTNPSIVKVALLHDLCKLEEFGVNEEGQPVRKHSGRRGHGALSVKILEELGYELTPEEWRAIRWHMGGHHTHTPEEIEDVKKTRGERLFKLVHAADQDDAADDCSMRAPGTLILRDFDHFLRLS